MRKKKKKKIQQANFEVLMKEKGVLLVYTEIEKVTILQEMASSPLTGTGCFLPKTLREKRVESGRVNTTYF